MSDMTINVTSRKAVKKTQKNITKILVYVFLLALAVLILIPFWAIFAGTFQEGTMLIRYGLNLKIDFSKANLNNYYMLFTDSGNYFRWFFNSIGLTVVQVVLTLFISAFVAYGFAAYEFRFKNVLFICVLLIMSVPFEMLMLPL